MSPFTPRNWTDGSAPALSAANIEDLETRLSDYTDANWTTGTTSIFNVKHFGATGDGVTDDTAAIQDCLDYARFHDAALTFAGVIWFPEGTYIVSSTLTVNYTFGFKILGAGSDGRHHASMMPTIKFTGGAGSGPVLNARDCTGITIQGLTFLVDDTDFDDWTIDLSGPNADAQQNAIIGCGFTGPYSATPAGHIYLNKSIIGTIEGCHFVRSGIQVAIGNANYVVGWTLKDNTFNTAYDVPIRIKGGAEAINIGPNNVFEAAVEVAGGASRAIRFESNNCWVCNIDGNWFGDAAGDPWIEMTGGTWFSGSISGNRFSGGNTAPALKITAGAMTGVCVMGNRLDNCPLDFTGAVGNASNVFLGNTAYGPEGDGVVNAEDAGALIADFYGILGLSQDRQYPKVGIGVSEGSDVVYPLDIQSGSTTGKGIRILGSGGSGEGVNFGGTEGAVDADVFIGRAQAKVLALGSDHQFRVGTIAAASAANNTIFVDSSNGKLSFKDGSGTTNALY